MQVSIKLKDGSSRGFLVREIDDSDPEEIHFIIEDGYYTVIRKDMIVFYDVIPLEG